MIPTNIEGLLDRNYHFKQLLRVVQDMEKSKWVERANISKKMANRKFSNDYSSGPFTVVPTNAGLEVSDKLFIPALKEYLLISDESCDNAPEGKFRTPEAKGEYYRIHDEIKFQLAAMAKDAGVGAVVVEPNLGGKITEGKSYNRPDLLFQHMQNTNDTYVDVTVVRTGSKSHRKSAANVTGGAANKAERGKLLNTPYAAMAKKDGRDFLPMGVEDSGAFGKGFYKMLLNINKERLRGKKNSDDTMGTENFLWLDHHPFKEGVNWSTPNFLKHWIVRIQIALLKHRTKVRSQSNENILTDMFRKAEEKSRKSRKRKRIMVEDDSNSISESSDSEDDNDDVGLLRIIEREREKVERVATNNYDHQGSSNVGQELQLQQSSVEEDGIGMEEDVPTLAQKQKSTERVLGICCGVQHFAISCPSCGKDLVAHNGQYNKREYGRCCGLQSVGQCLGCGNVVEPEDGSLEYVWPGQWQEPDEGIDQQGHEIDIGEDTGSETEMNDME